MDRSLLCHVISQISDLLPTCCRLVIVKIVCRVANKSATSWQLPRLRGTYGETCLMDFGHYTAFVIVATVPLYVYLCCINPLWLYNQRLSLNFRIMPVLQIKMFKKSPYFRMGSVPDPKKFYFKFQDFPDCVSTVQDLCKPWTMLNSIAVYQQSYV